MKLMKSKCQIDWDRHQAQSFLAKSTAEKHDLFFPFLANSMQLEVYFFPCGITEWCWWCYQRLRSNSCTSCFLNIISASLTAVSQPTLSDPILLSTPWQPHAGYWGEMHPQWSQRCWWRWMTWLLHCGRLHLARQHSCSLGHAMGFL